MKNLTESATYTSSVPVPEDNVDLRTAASIETAFQALTNRTKYLHDNGALTSAASSTDNALARFDGTTGKTIQAGLVTESDTGTLANIENVSLSGEVSYASPKTRTMLLPLDSGYAGTGITAGSWNAIFATDSSVLTVPIRLAEGSVITGFRVKWKPGDTRSVGYRMAASLQSYAPDLGNTTTPSVTTIQTITDNGSTSVQTTAASGLSTTVANGTTVYHVSITAGGNASTNNDTVYGIEITYTDPGPRNA